MNNTANDGTPYFLTANHCLGNPGNWVYYFNHESATCNGNNGPTNQSISGGTLLVNSGGSDVALIELSQTPPPSFNVQSCRRFLSRDSTSMLFCISSISISWRFVVV